MHTRNSLVRACQARKRSPTASQEPQIKREGIYQPVDTIRREAEAGDSDEPATTDMTIHDKSILLKNKPRGCVVQYFQSSPLPSL